MSKPILFLGDTSLQSAASYLAGCLANAGWEFDYLPSDQPVSGSKLMASRKLIIISDYPASNISDEIQQQIIQHVQQGTGLLMIGGWESFQGAEGDWAGTKIGNFLPVEISTEDDRQNCDQPVFVRCKISHPITNGLPWKDCPPIIGGYNKVTAKKSGSVILEAERYAARLSQDENICQMTYVSSDPLLVVDETQPGRVAALATDLAPHWVGPLVDWGSQRVPAQAAGAADVEVGSDYIKFVQQIIAWVGQLDRDV